MIVSPWLSQGESNLIIVQIDLIFGASTVDQLVPQCILVCFFFGFPIYSSFLQQKLSRCPTDWANPLPDLGKLFGRFFVIYHLTLPRDQLHQ